MFTRKKVLPYKHTEEHSSVGMILPYGRRFFRMNPRKNVLSWIHTEEPYFVQTILILYSTNQFFQIQFYQNLKQMDPKSMKVPAWNRPALQQVLWLIGI